MALLHRTDHTHIPQTVSKFRLNFYGQTKLVEDPNNKIQIKVDIWTVVGIGKQRRYGSSSVTSKLIYSCIFDPEAKTLTKDGQTVEMSNAAAVLDAIDEEVKQTLTAREFGNAL
jgi:hypothetical protein